MATGNINVTAENIFPIIKKFLYSDHDIFLREIVSNAVDATQKLKTLASKGEYSGDLSNAKVEIKLDKKAKTISVSDNGIGMTAEEIVSAGIDPGQRAEQLSLSQFAALARLLPYDTN